MTKSNNRGWHCAWTWDVSKCKATHVSGLVVWFEFDGVAWRASINSDNERTVLQTLASDSDATQATRTLARLKREAVDGFYYAVKKHAYDTAKAQDERIKSGHA